MPFEQAIWRLDDKLTRLSPAAIAKEIDLEVCIANDPSILDSGWMIIGRQVASDVGFIDLIALDKAGAVILIELKRAQTPREVTAQALDYAAWIEGLTLDRIAGIYKTYCEKYRPDDKHTTLDSAFHSRFGLELPAEDLNSSHQIVIVATELDARTERIIRYLSARGLEINVLFFQIFADDSRKLLSRVWLLDQVEIESSATRGRTFASVDWNGEFYASFGIGSARERNWDDAVKFGFISAGGGRWYSNSLQLAEPGARVWAKVPGKGYVGVGEITGTLKRADDFSVSADGKEVSVLDVARYGPDLHTYAADADRAEYFVPVRWIKTVPVSKAISEVGLFGNQHSLCRPKDAKWLHTVERLKQLFSLD